MIIIVVLSAIVGLAVCLLLYSYFARGGVRITAQVAGTLIFFPAVVALAVAGLGRNSSISTSLGVVGILVSFVFGFAGNRLTLSPLIKPKVAIVISSKDPFHQEIRRALYSELKDISPIIIDEGGSASAAREDLIAFTDLLRRANEASADYIVMWPPGMDAVRMAEIKKISDDLFRRGGLCIFLETPPVDLDLRGRVAVLRHDAQRAGELLSKAVADYMGPETRLLLVLGPVFSQPAILRNGALTAAWPETGYCRHLPLATWSSVDALGAIHNVIRSGYVPDVVICPNDTIALALCDAIATQRDLRRLHSKHVIGFDGLSRACASIAEVHSPFGLTIAIPPAEYGVCAARIIKELARVSLRPWRRLEACATETVLSMDGRNIINPSRARRRLYDE